jgi:hypothetical protein
MVGLTALVTTTYRWSEARYTTRSDRPDAGRAEVLHIAFDRQLTIGEVEELLRADGARVIAGPDTTGVFGIAPVATADGHNAQQMHQLAARLRTDPRVRWVEPIDMDDTAPEKSPSRGQ